MTEEMHPEILSWHEQFVGPEYLSAAEGKKILTEENIAYLRARPQIRVAVTAGAMDLTHAGHCLVFEEPKALKLCDLLLVLIHTDPSIDRPDTKAKPVQSLHARFTQVRKHEDVDLITFYDTEDELYHMLDSWCRPHGGFIDLRVIGSDYLGKDFTGKDIPLGVHYNWRGHDYSTTNLRTAVVAAEPSRQKIVRKKLLTARPTVPQAPAAMLRQ